MPIRCDGVGVLGRRPTPPGVPRPTGVRSEGSARRAWMTVVRGRADSFVAADSPLVRAKIAKIAVGREERQSHKGEKLLLFFAHFADFAPLSNDKKRSPSSSREIAMKTHSARI